MIRRTLFLTFIAIVLVLIQGSILRAWINPSYPIPQLIIPAVVVMGFFSPTLNGLIQAFILSFVFDLFSGGPWGVWCAVGMMTFGIVSFIARQMFVDSAIVVAGLSAGATFLGEIFAAVLVHGLEYGWGGVVLHALGDAVVTALIAPILLFPGRKILRNRAVY